MKIAALTFVFNENVNLPIWRRYYGQQFGEKNLFVIDRESNDGSTDDLGEINRIVVPRDAFDDRKKASIMSSFQNGIINYYDAMVIGDCDEIAVPDPNKYTNLADYAQRMQHQYSTCVGVDLLHIIHKEPPIDLTKPIMEQRRFGRFRTAGCKTMLSRIPLRWGPGLHYTDHKPWIDPDLINVHLKTMDYQCAMLRQKVNQTTEWSEASLAANFGGHHRYNYDRFVQEAFFDPVNLAKQNQFGPFELSNEIADLIAKVKVQDGGYTTSSKMTRWVEFPESFRGAF